mgnify:CR=1 FL=1
MSTQESSTSTLSMLKAAVASMAVASVANAGLMYFLDPKFGGPYREIVRRRARALLHSAEKLGSNLAKELGGKTNWLRRQVGPIEPLRPAKRAPAGIEMATAVWTGLTVGAGLMYFLDPQQGPSRRASLRNRLALSRSSVKRVARRLFRSPPAREETSVHSPDDAAVRPSPEATVS